jgi:hypothetical protein
MRKLYLGLLVLLFATNTFSQTQKYFRVQIFTGDSGLHVLADAGIGFDHGEYSKNHWFISDFSEDELDIIRRNGYPYKILIDDVATYYAERNNIPETEFPVQLPGGCTAYATPKNFTFGSMGGFYTYKEMLAALDSMRIKFPKLISARKPVSVKTTAEGRPLYYVKISDHPNTDENEPKILYTALHHAREPESLSQLIFFMWYLLENYQTDPFVKSLVDSTEMYFIPCVNPDGYIYNQTTNPNGGGLWRKNRRNNGDGSFGVDLNRNYGYMWGYDNSGSSPNGYDDTYRGPSPFSEPETQMVRDFGVAHSFFFALNHHTYANALIYPYGYRANKLTPDSTKFKQYATRLAQCNGFTTGTVNQTLGYTANGTSDDWLYGNQSVKSKIFALTPESGSSFDGFWPRKSRIIPLAQVNLDMNLTAAEFTKESVYTVSNVVSSNVNDVLKGNEEFGEVQSFPNPCNTYTWITWKQIKAGNNDLTLQIFNAGGILIKSIKLNEVQTKILVNTGNLKAGVYYYFLMNGKYKSRVQKLVVAK